MPKHDALKVIFTKVGFDWLSEKYGQADLSIFMLGQFKLAIAWCDRRFALFFCLCNPRQNFKSTTSHRLDRQVDRKDRKVDIPLGSWGGLVWSDKGSYIKIQVRDQNRAIMGEN